MIDIKDIHPQFRWVLKYLDEWRNYSTTGEWRIEFKKGGIVRIHRTITEHANDGVKEIERQV